MHYDGIISIRSGLTKQTGNMYLRIFGRLKTYDFADPSSKDLSLDNNLHFWVLGFYILCIIYLYSVGARDYVCVTSF